jgi:hypothetical protein
MAKAQTCYFSFSNGLRGCYMPDNYGGHYAVTRRKDLVDAIRNELDMLDAPKSALRQISIKRLWSQAKRYGTSSIHFTLDIGPGYGLNFHGLTETEYNEQESQND